MAIEADLVTRFAQLRVVFGAVNVVTTGAGNTAPVHEALDEVVALHAILVGRAVSIVSKCGFA